MFLRPYFGFMLITRNVQPSMRQHWMESNVSHIMIYVNVTLPKGG